MFCICKLLIDALFIFRKIKTMSRFSGISFQAYFHFLNKIFRYLMLALIVLFHDVVRKIILFLGLLDGLMAEATDYQLNVSAAFSISPFWQKTGAQDKYSK